MLNTYRVEESNHTDKAVQSPVEKPAALNSNDYQAGAADMRKITTTPSESIKVTTDGPKLPALSLVNESAEKPSSQAPAKAPAADKADAEKLTAEKPTAVVSNDPVETVVKGNSGEAIHKEWNNGPLKGEKEDIAANGNKVHYKPDGKGGEIVETTMANGTHTIDHGYPDGKGGVTVDSKDLKDDKNSYTAHYGADGHMTVDYKDGTHMERYGADKVTHTTMTGPLPKDNYTAIETADQAKVTYKDGSSFVEQRTNGHNETTTFDSNGKPYKQNTRDVAANSSLATEWDLIGGYWMSESQLAADVKSKSLKAN